jgi:hypothetical protein
MLLLVPPLYQLDRSRRADRVAGPDPGGGKVGTSNGQHCFGPLLGRLLSIEAEDLVAHGGIVDGGRPRWHAAGNRIPWHREDRTRCLTGDNEMLTIEQLTVSQLTTSTLGRCLHLANNE